MGRRGFLGILGDANGRAAVSEDEDSRPATEPVHTAPPSEGRVRRGVAANTETVCEFNPSDPDAFKPAPPACDGKDDAREADDHELITPAAAAAAREKSGAAQPRGRTMYTFGRGFHGQLGQGGYDDAAAPATVTFGAEACIADATAIESVSCGASHCAGARP